MLTNFPAVLLFPRIAQPCNACSGWRGYGVMVRIIINNNADNETQPKIVRAKQPNIVSYSKHYVVFCGVHTVSNVPIQQIWRRLRPRVSNLSSNLRAVRSIWRTLVGTKYCKNMQMYVIQTIQWNIVHLPVVLEFFST